MYSLQTIRKRVGEPIYNTTDPDPIPQNMASDQGLPCLHLGKEFL